MIRSYRWHALSPLLGLATVSFLGAAAIAGCSSEDTSGSSSSSSSDTSTSTGGGMGGSSTSTTTATGGGMGGMTSSTDATTTTTGTGGAGGAGGATASTSGTGGSGGAGGMGGTGGSGGSGGMAPLDGDGDGWLPSDGDCCDNVNDCSNPELVNPGAFEYLGNGLDDDCDPSTPDDTPVADCGGNALVTPTSSTKLIKAMDLCQFTVENPATLQQKKWGVISTSLLQADGTATPPKDVQVGVLADYGPYVMPQKGGTMAAMSSGTARDETDTGHVYPQNGLQAGQTGNYDATTVSGAPPAYLAGNGGAVPSPGNCPSCQGAGCTTAYDSVNLKARIRVPTNAFSFTYSFKFYSSEYPEFVCQQYNDFFVTLLTTQWQPDPMANPPELPLPADKNIAFDSNGNAVSVNNAFFEVCFPPVGAPAGTCPSGTLELVGTGMGGWPSGGVSNVKDGGGTVWLKNDAPVVPGETIEIEFITWDAGDHNVDSMVLLDKFKWNVTPSTVGVHK